LLPMGGARRGLAHCRGVRGDFRQGVWMRHRGNRDAWACHRNGSFAPHGGLQHSKTRTQESRRAEKRSVRVGRSMASLTRCVRTQWKPTR
jgi:hypothetical protein